MEGLHLFLLLQCHFVLSIILNLCSVLQELPGDEALTPTNFRTYMRQQADAATRLQEKTEQLVASLWPRFIWCLPTSALNFGFLINLVESALNLW